MKIWIDIVNSPHVLFFEPIIKSLVDDGHAVFVTARDFAQTKSILRAKGIDFFLTGRHMGRSLFLKGVGLLYRSFSLFLYGMKIKPDIALSHNSNDLAIAARFLGVPHLMFHDYEYATIAHRLNFMFVDKIYFPDVLDLKELEAIYGKTSKIGRYPGLKEQVYLPHAKIEPVRSILGVSENEILGIVRPPADFALYHRFQNPLFDKCMNHLQESEVKIVVLPRTAEQKDKILKQYPRFIIPEEVLDGPSLIADADFVLSAGGTMNREAAVLGTPAYTVFAGKIGAVDKFLIDRGYLTKVEKPEDIKIEKKEHVKKPQFPSTLKQIIEIIYDFAREHGRL